VISYPPRRWRRALIFTFTLLTQRPAEVWRPWNSMYAGSWSSCLGKAAVKVMEIVCTERATASLTRRRRLRAFTSPRKLGSMNCNSLLWLPCKRVPLCVTTRLHLTWGIELVSSVYLSVCLSAGRMVLFAGCVASLTFLQSCAVVRRARAALLSTAGAKVCLVDPTQRQH
jgi:hypothetical protein